VTSSTSLASFEGSQVAPIDDDCNPRIGLLQSETPDVVLGEPPSDVSQARLGTLGMAVCGDNG
jgi:hypothetical protein